MKNLRPRTKGPPGDHTYSSHNASGVVYVTNSARNQHSELVKELPENTVEDVDVPNHNNDIEEKDENKKIPATSNQSCKKRRRRRKAFYDFEPKKKRSKNSKSSVLESIDVRVTETSCTYSSKDMEYETSQGHKTLAVKSISCSNAQCPLGPAHHLKSQQHKRSPEKTSASRHSQRLVKKNLKLPFEELPYEVKLIIFSFLKPAEKAKAKLVCREWLQLAHDKDSWLHINLDHLAEPYAMQLTENTRQWKKLKSQKYFYNQYQIQVTKFIGYLATFQPKPISLTFSLDLGNYMDNWYQVISDLFSSIQLSNLRAVFCNWQCTPHKPTHLEHFCCIYNKVRTLFRLHIRRVSVFHKLLDTLSRWSPRISQMEMPFDWSPRSGLFLSRFKNLTTLKLTQYIRTQSLDQQVLSAVLRALPKLKQLEVTIVIPTFNRRPVIYKMNHPNIQMLRLYNCQGFFLKDLDMPNLTEIRLDRLPWRSFELFGGSSAVRCLGDVFAEGTPKLELLNGQNWPQRVARQDAVGMLKHVCPCPVHWPQGNLVTVPENAGPH